MPKEVDPKTGDQVPGTFVPDQPSYDRADARLTVACAICGAAPGELCTTGGGNVYPLGEEHGNRQ